MLKRNLSSIIAIACVFALIASPTLFAGETAWLGIYTQTVDRDLQEAFDLQSDYGVVVKYVVDDSPADEAGLRQGDIVLKIDGDKTDDADRLIDIVGSKNPGDKIEMTIIRNGKEKTLSATLTDREERDNEPMIGSYGHNAPRIFSKSWTNRKSYMSSTYIGMELQTMGKQLSEYFGISDGTGILISEVYDDSPAKKAGLEAGDVVLKADGTDIEEVSDLQKIVADKNDGDQLVLTILRDKKEKDVEVTIEETPDNFGKTFGQGMTPFNWEDFDIYLPQMKGLFRGNFYNDDQDYRQRDDENSAELKNDLRELKKEMQQLKDELNDLREND